MPLEIIRQDITKIKCDAIVNPTDARFSGSGGTDAAIHAAAGKKLERECARLGECPVGEARLTKAYALPCRYIIHTVGPKWSGDGEESEKLLRSCYESSLKIASEKKFKDVAFPLISSGTFGCPKETALKIAFETISAFLLESEMLIYIVVFDSKSFAVSKKLIDNVSEFIDENYVDEYHDFFRSTRYLTADFEESVDSQPLAGASFNTPPENAQYTNAMEAVPLAAMADSPKKKKKKKEAGAESLEERLRVIDESFSEMLFRKIDELGMTDPECYKAANIDRKHFSKIRDSKYKPSKNTVIALGIALRLPLKEFSELLMKAGFALSHSSKFDVIIEYFIINGYKDIFEINEVLYSFDQPILGGGKQ